LDIGIFPRPQWARPLSGAATWAAPLRIAVSPDHRASADLLAEQLHARFGLAAEVVDMQTGTAADITIGALTKRDTAAAAEMQRPGGYLLEIGPAGVRIAGHDAAGVFYGMQSLLQRAAASAHGSGDTLTLPGLEVRDWPYKPLRGVHLYMPGRKDIPFFKRLLAWLASLKYNTLFLEVGGGMRYDRRPEINRAWEKFCAEADAYPGGASALYNRSQPFLKDSTHTELGGGSYLEKAEVAELLAYARSLHIEVVPEVQALSHAYYLCCAYPEIAERGDDPWPDTCCPSHPDTYTILFDVMEEVIEVFAPRMIHIGHDEVYAMGLCPRCRDTHPSELLADEVLRIHGFLAERGIRLAMWGDKLLPFDAGGQGGVAIVHARPEYGQHTVFPETYQAIHRLPRDILMAEWLGNRDPRAIQFFLKEGFEVYCGNFGDNFAAHAFPRWHERSAPAGVIGGEVSTWCEVSEFALGYNGCIFNLLFAAPLLWWSHYRDLDREALEQAIVARMPAVRARLGEASALPGAAAASLLTGEQTLHPAPFAPARPALRLDSQTHGPMIPVGLAAASLCFTHTCVTAKRRRPTWALADPYDHPADNLLGVYSVHYADGEVIRIPIHYGAHIARWDIPYGEEIDAIPYWADPVALAREPGGRRVTLYRYTWSNPRPNALIRRVRLIYTGDADGQIWIFDITAAPVAPER
jgi:hypothetical protein